MSTISNERLEKMAAGGGFNFNEVEEISAELLELIYAFGAEIGVRWSEDAQEAIEWARRTGRRVAA
ncbi:hypothetical protein R2296_001898 [Cronobacter sakazakii]|nr:hypothetical protein [Cronobacter sakazakii]